LVITSLILAHKYNEDVIYTDSAISKACLVETDKIAKMEQFFCYEIGFEFFVEKIEYGIYYKAIKKSAMSNYNESSTSKKNQKNK